MPEIRVKVSPKLHKIISDLSEKIGVTKVEYVKELIINELKREFIAKTKEK